VTSIDVAISDEGSIVLFHLFTSQAEHWVRGNVQPGAQWFGGALVVEHRYAAAVVHGMVERGLRVQLTRVGVS
jgi:hypothetical protein